MSLPCPSLGTPVLSLLPSSTHAIRPSIPPFSFAVAAAVVFSSCFVCCTQNAHTLSARSLAPPFCRLSVCPRASNRAEVEVAGPQDSIGIVKRELIEQTDLYETMGRVPICAQEQLLYRPSKSLPGEYECKDFSTMEPIEEAAVIPPRVTTAAPSIHVRAREGRRIMNMASLQPPFPLCPVVPGNLCRANCS